MECEEKVFDIEKVTKKFYDRFQKEHAIFMNSIQGLKELDEQKYEQHAWHTSLILNRLMFLYFLQQQGFLATTSTSRRNGDTDYLRNRLHMIQKQKNKDVQNSFYHYFLLPLFHNGLSKRERTPAMERLFGKIPYLHNDLFSAHTLEYAHYTIEIPDTAFERIFNFFDEFQWILENRPLRNEREINSDVLGNVFEKHINQQQMGAYYTREDVTTYIARNSILPTLFDAAEYIYPQVFGKEGTVWELLRCNPARYMQGVTSSEKYLPTETEREYRERQAYHLQIREQIEKGEICSMADFISYNLTLDLFIQDVLHNIDKPEVLHAFYQCLTQLTILDPTCGSGAFLCAALRILVPIYATCLAQMKIVGATFTTSLDTMGALNQALTILKSIINTNLYGVDIMEEATELCKLRLFLLLVAALNENENIESLAEVNLHIRTGNALIGFPQTILSQPQPAQSTQPIRRGASLPPPGPNSNPGSNLPNPAQASSHPYIFTQQSSDEVQRRLDWELAREYGIDASDEKRFEQWRKSHKPFHWKYEFAEVGNRGGFDCIIGNPPYVEYAEEKFPYRLQHYTMLACGNLYPCVIERSRALLAPHGRLGMIVPLAAFATRNMQPLIEGVQRWFAGSWISFYHFRPSMLFSGSKVASIPTAILLARIDGQEHRFSTSINRWMVENRKLLFSTLKYSSITASRDPANRHYYAKFGQVCENTILEKVMSQRCVGDYLARIPNENSMYYRSAGGLYWKVFLNFPWPYQTTSNKQCMFREEYERDIFVALFNSSLFWWYYSVTFDTFNLKDYMLFGFHFTYPEDTIVVNALSKQCKRLMEDFRQNAKHLKRGETGSYTIYARKSKQILDTIDTILARQYGLSSSELDFILHYDIKYRMGSELL